MATTKKWAVQLNGSAPRVLTADHIEVTPAGDLILRLKKTPTHVYAAGVWKAVTAIS